MDSKWPDDRRDASAPRPTFDISSDDDTDSDSGNGSDKEEKKVLIMPDKKNSATKEFRRISTNCMHPKVPCPTCKGKGKLSQAQSDTMLALIPMHDNRLKPKRTALKLGIAFCFILIICGLCLAFLFPRKVYLSLQSVTVTNHSCNENVVAKLSVFAYVNNTNFFAVRVSNLSVQVLFLPTIDRTPHEVGNIQLYSTEHIGLRENKKVNLFVTTIYTGKDASTIKDYCNWFQDYRDVDNVFPTRISLSASLKYWTHTEQLENSVVKYIHCNSMVQNHQEKLSILE